MPACSAYQMGAEKGRDPRRFGTERNCIDDLNMRGNRVGACPITQRSIIELQRELYVAFALRAIEETEVETKPYVGSIQNGGVCNIEELSPEFQPLRFTEREFLLNA